MFTNTNTNYNTNTNTIVSICKFISNKILIFRDPRYGVSSLIKQVSTAVLPFYHMFGLYLGVMTLMKGYLLVVFDHFDEYVFLNAIQKYRVTILNMVPSIAVILSKSQQLQTFDVSSVVTLLCGGAPLSKPTEDELKKR